MKSTKISTKETSETIFKKSSILTVLMKIFIIL